MDRKKIGIILIAIGGIASLSMMFFLSLDLVFIVLIIVFPVGIGLLILSAKMKKKDGYTRDKYIQSPESNTHEDSINMLKQNQNEKALDILKERLVTGKITKEEYDSLKKEFE